MNKITDSILDKLGNLGRFSILVGNNISKLKNIPSDSIDSVVTDPPYGISFMNKKLDYDVPSVKLWQEVFRVLKPGGHVLSFSSARTYHRMTVNIEDAGFEIRDQLIWLYATGFGVSPNIGKMIDDKLGNERTIINSENSIGYSEQEGWGIKLKPAHEPICMARKPLSEKTIVDNVLKYGTGIININDCKIDNETGIGRFPTNFIHDGSDEVLSTFELYGEKKSGKSNGNAKVGIQSNNIPFRRGTLVSRNDSGTAARFFYSAKASFSDREDGLEDLKTSNKERKNTHNTVKPTSLMEYLCKLVTPKNGIVLDPFMGSGSTGRGSLLGGFRFIGIEIEQEYCNIAEKRIKAILNNEKVVSLKAKKLF